MVATGRTSGRTRRPSLKVRQNALQRLNKKSKKAVPPQAQAPVAKPQPKAPAAKQQPQTPAAPQQAQAPAPAKHPQVPATAQEPDGTHRDINKAKNYAKPPVANTGYCYSDPDSNEDIVDTAGRWPSKSDQNLDALLSKLQLASDMSRPVSPRTAPKSAPSQPQLHQHVNMNQPGMPSAEFWYQPNPSMYLRGPNSEKYHDIVDYVYLTPPYQERVVDDCSSADLLDQLVKAKLGPTRPRLEDVSIAQWNIANMRILDVLLDAPTALGPIRYYMAYTMRINTYFTKFDRVKVLLYDRAYRIKQAQFNTPWGIDIGFLKDNYLLDGDLETTRGQQRHTAAEKPISMFKSIPS